MTSGYFRLRSELSGAIAKNHFSVPVFSINSLHIRIYIYIQSTPLISVTSVRGNFDPIKRRTLLTEDILYQLLCVRAIPVLPKVAH